MDVIGEATKAVEAVMDACYGGSLAELQISVRRLISVGAPEQPPNADEASKPDASGTFSCDELSALESLRDSKHHGVAHIAAAGGNLIVLQYLLAALPSLAHVEDDNGENPLFYAIRAATGRSESGRSSADFLSCVLLLLARCGPNSLSKSGASALHVAVELGATEVCRLLVENHADVDVYSKDYGTPLTVAVIRGYVDIVEFLLSHGAQPDGIPSPGSARRAVIDCRFPPPLVFACSSGQGRVCDLLLAAGASLSLGDSEGWTPLHCAAEVGSVEIVKKLLSRNADCNVKVQGKTPYYLAVWNGHGAVATLLRDRTEDKGPVDFTEPPAMSVEQPDPMPDPSTYTFPGPREERDRLVGNLRETGRVLVSRKEYDNACETYSRAIALLAGDNDSPSEPLSVLYSNRSHTYLMTGNLDQAREDAEACIALNPQWPKGYLRLANVDKESGRQVDYLHNLFQAYSRDTSNTSLRDLFQAEFLKAKSASSAK
ncbi:ankyrin repeat containing protein / TPR domain-containing protein, putative [Babesia caballi]|uniref:Ankyrin repeat containing protein / TPR domain-containing protein, putative n=1 Tax=Babesia caballi TaxID=5871 RepID=A0AAV4LQH2_BABCB|nr:ankyrin repeat containing protein / TPR domain-containing protein, putative [Babesia caballi]